MQNKETGRQPQQRSSIANLGTASIMGMHLISGPIVGVFFGWLVDKLFGIWPIASAIGLILGFGAGFLNVWYDAGNFTERNKNDESNQNVPDQQFDRKD